MIRSRRARQEYQIDRTSLSAHGRDRQRRAILILDEQEQFPGADGRSHWHRQVAGGGLAFDCHTINHSMREGLLANCIFRNLRYRQRY